MNSAESQQHSTAAPRQVVILTEGYSTPFYAKTACSYIRYRTDEVVALIDSTQLGKTAEALLDVGGDIPVVASLSAAPTANTLLLGIAPPGGKLPEEWKALILEALGRKMLIISGLHDFLSDDVEIAAAAEKLGGCIVDIRKND